MNAIRAEEDSRLSEATTLYLRDAAECLNLGLKARSALSCSCAATCLQRMGNVNAARRLYLETAKIYEEQADASFSTSIRDALWLLQEAHDYYVLGGDSNGAAKQYERCVEIVKKLDPFASDGNLDRVLRIRRNTQTRAISYSVPTPQAPEMSAAIDGFLRLRDQQPSKPTQTARAVSATYRRPSVEKSIVS